MGFSGNQKWFQVSCLLKPFLLTITFTSCIQWSFLREPSKYFIRYIYKVLYQNEFSDELSLCLHLENSKHRFILHTQKLLFRSNKGRRPNWHLHLFSQGDLRERIMMLTFWKGKSLFLFSHSQKLDWSWHGDSYCLKSFIGFSLELLPIHFSPKAQNSIAGACHQTN